MIENAHLPMKHGYVFAGVILAVLLTTLGNVWAQSNDPRPLTQSQSVQDKTITVTVMPGTGDQGVMVQLQDSQGRPVNGATVTVEPVMVGMNMPSQPSTAVPAIDGRYDSRIALSMAGTWQLRVSATLPTASPLVATFDVPVVASVPLPSRPSTVPQPRPFFTWWTGAAVALVLLGLVTMVAALRLRRVPTGPALMGSWVLILVGVLTWLVPAYVSANAPPADPKAAALVRAQPLYQRNCLPCHGVGGKGDGPAGRTLNPHPADLTAPHVDQHPDGQIYTWIHSGFPGSAMPAFGDRLTSDQIWDLVDYVRHFRSQAQNR